MGPKASDGKNDNAAIIIITTKTIIPKVELSVFSVPALSGTYFLVLKLPAIATGPIIEIYRERISTNPVLMFHHIVLSFNPSKPLPLLAEAEVNS